MSADIPFISLLEQYVFCVAAQFIGMATKEEQASLINLFNTIDKSSASGNRPDELP
ncbi:hypothetical protein [Spirosoma endophyticum]|uniref:Uncharacterized protein n=1 Tax=Spirosoma endophyticum TaxID=662367 RepID=A0A1I2EIH1_9BACT|nr:hypothetical protein [Spirosoma endophyticum]SFE92894.1 hypothetical protein SAMN05216167_12245 [Spirosoma endophyticum]